MGDRKMEAVGAALMGASGAASIYSLGPKNTNTNRIQERRKKQNKKITESKTKINQAKISLAKEQLQRLERIKNGDLEKKNVKVKNELIKKQKDIIKKGTSNTLKDIAKKIGLSGYLKVLAETYLNIDYTQLNIKTCVCKEELCQT